MSRNLNTICQFPENMSENVESLQICNFVYEPKVDSSLKIANRLTYRVYIVTKGTATLNTDYTSFELSKGSVFITFPEKRMELDQVQKLSLIYVSFTGIESAYLLKQLRLNYVSPVKTCPEWLVPVFYREFRRVQTDRGVALCAKGLLYMLFSYFNEYTHLAQEDKKQATVKAIIAYIESNYKDPELSLKQVSEALFYHFNYISQVFKGQMGVTFSAYVADFRFRKAMVFLTETDLSIEQISHEVGFGDYKYFMRSFKKNMGKTPTEYRNETRKIKI